MECSITACHKCMSMAIQKRYQKQHDEGTECCAKKENYISCLELHEMRPIAILQREAGRKVCLHICLDAPYQSCVKCFLST